MCTVRALQNDIFEWHFVIRGPADSEFEVRRKAGSSVLDARCTGIWVPHPPSLDRIWLVTFAAQGGIYHGRILLPAEYPFKVSQPRRQQDSSSRRALGLAGRTSRAHLSEPFCCLLPVPAAPSLHDAHP